MLLQVIYAGEMEPKMMRYSRLMMMLGCMVVTGILFAQPAADDSKATTTQQTEPQKRSPPVKQRTRQPEKPATTFKPSERISADSAVSFPVDI